MAEPPAAPRLNLVFDLGAVIFDWQPRRLLATVLPAHTGTPQAADRLFDLFFRGHGGEWGEFDRGTIDVPALTAGIAARTGLSETEVLRVLDAVPGELQPIPGSVALVHELKALGHRLFYLSNMPAPYADHLLRSHAVFDCFDDGVFSSRVKLIKPEPAIYEHAVQRFGVRPADCVFLDDLPMNVEAACEAGWQALLFVDAAKAREDLCALAVIAP